MALRQLFINKEQRGRCLKNFNFGIIFLLKDKLVQEFLLFVTQWARSSTVRDRSCVTSPQMDITWLSLCSLLLQENLITTFLLFKNCSLKCTNFNSHDSGWSLWRPISFNLPYSYRLTWLFDLPLRSKKSREIWETFVTRGSVSLSCATTPHPSCIS